MKELEVLGTFLETNYELDSDTIESILNDDRFAACKEEMLEAIKDWNPFETNTKDFADDLKYEFGELIEEAITNFYMEHENQYTVVEGR